MGAIGVGVLADNLARIVDPNEIGAIGRKRGVHSRERAIAVNEPVLDVAGIDVGTGHRAGVVDAICISAESSRRVQDSVNAVLPGESVVVSAVIRKGAYNRGGRIDSHAKSAAR